MSKNLSTNPFSQRSISKHVKTKATNNVVTLGSGAFALGIVGITAAATGGLPLWALLAAGGCGLVSVGSLTNDLTARKHSIVSRYLQEAKQFLAEKADRHAQSLLVRAEDSGNEKAIQQIQELETSFRDFRELVDGKLQDSGFAHARFIGSVEQAREEALSMIEEILDSLDAIESIPDDLGDRVDSSNDRVSELRRERLGHKDRVYARIDELYAGVEHCLTKISELSIKIPRIGKGDNSDAVYQRSLRELESLGSLAQTINRET